ncbi:hypothetical protein [Rhizobium binae]|uniref:hypothetical protein n=1 Tax=Rhizobium binae TaxID=1138190 RepID=UPI001C833856|nr:hypothetical protein [Rhizobium binae]
MHAKLVKEDRRQQMRTDEAARRRMERRRRLADRLAVSAGKFGSDSISMKFNDEFVLFSERNQHDAGELSDFLTRPSRYGRSQC